MTNSYSQLGGGRNVYMISIQTCDYYINLDILASKLKLSLLPDISEELSNTQERAETQGPACLVFIQSHGKAIPLNRL